MKAGSSDMLRSLASAGRAFWHSTTSPSSSALSTTAGILSFGRCVWNVTAWSGAMWTGVDRTRR